MYIWIEWPEYYNVSLLRQTDWLNVMAYFHKSAVAIFSSSLPKVWNGGNHDIICWYKNMPL